MSKLLVVRGAPKQFALMPTLQKVAKHPKGELLHFTASTAAVDRAGDKVAQNFDFRGIRKNPVFLWAHRYGELPIGRIIVVGYEGGGANKVTKIAVLPVPKEIYPFAEQVRQMYAHDPAFLNCVSIGFRPLERKDMTPEEKQAEGMSPWGDWYTRSELLEVSAAPVPMHPDAVQERAFGDSKAFSLDANESWKGLNEGFNREGVERFLAEQDELEFENVEINELDPEDDERDSTRTVVGVSGLAVEPDLLDGDEVARLAKALDVVIPAGPVSLRALEACSLLKLAQSIDRMHKVLFEPTTSGEKGGEPASQGDAGPLTDDLEEDLKEDDDDLGEIDLGED